MATVIHSTKRQEKERLLPPFLRAFLPYRLNDEIEGMRGRIATVEELRLRCDRASSLTTRDGNVMLRTVLSRMEMDGILQHLCDGSLYAHSGTICQGYVTLQDGIRVGICGRATVEDGRIIGVYGVTGLNFRIPARYRRVGESVCTLLENMKGMQGVLIYSPPGVGKTTLLRSVAAKMASGETPLRVAVVDTRGEIAPFLDDPSLCVDILSGYPKKEGIEIACRTLNAQLIVCDEIGGVDEAAAIVASQNSGVPFVASAHADCVEGLLRRTSIRLLHEARIFGYYVGIRRRASGGDFIYDVTDWEEANARFEDRGGTDPRM